MNRFNLTFSGEITPGQQPDEVKLRFAEKFSIDDPTRLERFFSGQSIILRRNLERKEAAQLFQEMREIGVVAELVKVTAQDAAAAVTASAAAITSADAKSTAVSTPERQPPETATDQTTDDHGTTWASRKNATTKKKTRKKKGKTKSAPAAPSAEESPTMFASAIAAAPTENDKTADETVAITGIEQQKDIQRQAELELEAPPGPQHVSEKTQRASEESQRVDEEPHQAETTKPQDRVTLEKLETEKVLLAEQALADAKRLEAERQKELEKEREAAEQARLAEEEDARERAAEKSRQETHEKARQAAEEEARQLREAEEAEAERLRVEAERQREEAERVQKQAELERQEAQKKQIEAERVRKNTERERKKVELERKKVELERKKAERERKKAERQQKKIERERKEAEREQKRVEREKAKAEKERKKAEREAEKQEQARVKALQLAAQKAADEEARLKAAEQRALREAAEEQAKAEHQQLVAEEARRKADELAQQNAKLEKERRSAARAAARLEQELALKKRREAAALAKKKTAEKERQAEARKALKEQKRREEQELAALKAREEAANLAERAAMTEQAEQRAVGALAAQDGLASTTARVKTSLDVPQRSLGNHAATERQPTRKRQPGEPNLYSLRPFRNTPEVQNRATTARLQLRRYLSIGCVALVAFLLAAGSYLRYETPPSIKGADAIAALPQGGLLLLADTDLLLHDRAGLSYDTITEADLGVTLLGTPLAFTDANTLLITGKVIADSKVTTEPGGVGVCRIAALLATDKTCSAMPEAFRISQLTALVINPITANVIAADFSTQQLLKLSPEGKILAKASADLGESPRLQLHDGLLLVNSSQGPAISIFRYDDDAFGEQLDEVLLLPPPALLENHARVADFVRVANNWWVLLYNADTLDTGLYRFDEQWNYLDNPPLRHTALPLQLIAWGEKLLVNNPSQRAQQRFSSTGIVEVDLESKELQGIIERRQNALQTGALLWRVGLTVTFILALCSLVAAYLFRLRSLVYKSHREHGAVPVDDKLADFKWITEASNRQAILRRRAISYTLLVFAILLLAIGQSISALQLGALLIFLSGPAIALFLVSRHSVGHIAVDDEQLMLVDPDGMYHVGSHAQIHYRGNFLLIDDVVVFAGNALLPIFDMKQISQHVTRLATGGIRIDRKSLLVRLLQARHPMSLGLIAIIACSVTALLICCLGIL